MMMMIIIIITIIIISSRRLHPVSDTVITLTHFYLQQRSFRKSVERKLGGVEAFQPERY
jgi:hypothetical protein